MPEPQIMSDAICVMLFLVGLIATFVPFLTSPYLVLVTAGEIKGRYKITGDKLKPSSLSYIGLLLMLGSALLGLCWRMNELILISGSLSYVLMFAYTWMLVPIGFVISRFNGGELPKALKAVRLIFAVAAIPMAVMSIIMAFMLVASIISWSICAVITPITNLFKYFIVWQALGC